jgi:uncharacterized membrane protein YdbT with pleckstrin-like domain
VRGFAIHLFVYVGVVLLLAGVNLLTTPQHLWFTWVLLGWGAGVAAHAYAVFRRRG